MWFCFQMHRATAQVQITPELAARFGDDADLTTRTPPRCFTPAGSSNPS